MDQAEKELVDRALKSGRVSAEQLADAVRKQEILRGAGVRQSLAEILERDGVIKLDLLASEEPTLVGGAAEAGRDPVEGLALGGFVVERKLGEGGMGAVYKARQVSLGRPVALKVLSPRHAQDRDFVKRFEREARAAAALNHPHVVQPLEIGAERGYHYYAMEFCEGGSVASRIDAKGRFPEREALEVVKAIAMALGYAAELNMIHRDIKPDNILFTRTGIPKLADLGLAKERGESEQLTMTGMILGTPNYMSPEQALGKKDIDVRSDFYALGITLYEMLTGTVPYKGESALIILNMHVNEPLPDPRELAGGLSDGVVALLRRMTAKRREDRHPDAAALVADCDALLGGRPPASEDATVVGPSDLT
ncbi:MAG TPA: serine/threonine-protein kinase, partial [Planctomycetota bacterium]|nr:serine/threonine-protein kinase [Planctomycetota bacterium]